MASTENLVAWVFFLQRRDEQRHARLFDRIGAEVLGLPGDTPDERRAAAREHAPPRCSTSSRYGSPPWPPSSRTAAPGWARA